MSKEEMSKEAAEFINYIPEATYTAKIIESEYRYSSGGYHQIKTRWEVTHGPRSGYQGLWNYMTLMIENPNAVAIFFRQLKAIGITQDFLDNLAEVDNETAVKAIAAVLKGRIASLEVKIDEKYSNNKIHRISPAGLPS